ncbi:MAG: hypothetical protein R3F29_00105 [Planctomycetota bacterium]
MFASDQRRSVVTLLAFAACSAALTAQGVPVGWEESYALAADRAAVVQNLIPGTEDFYYYHCRERLDARDFATVRQVLPTWIQRHGRTGRVLEIENREALLSYDDNPERTFDLVRQRLGLTWSHQRAVPGARSDLPTRLDPQLVSPTALTQRAFRAHPQTVDGFTEHALAALANADLDQKQLRSLLTRLDRPDVENLPALIVRDLGERESRGFGSLPIHRLLRRPELEQCLALRPELLQDENFVMAYLVRLQPDAAADTDWRRDPAARAAQLQRLWQFVQRLAPRFNSLKAHVLANWLRHDLSQGAPDKDRFLAYIKLPRRQGYVSRQYLERFQRREELVDLGGEFPTRLPAAGSDEELVRTCLEHFFATEDGIAAWSDYLDARWLKRVLAETRLCAGSGDMEKWYSLLDDPTYLEQLEKRVELRFPPTMPEQFGADDAVRISIDTKNVPTLLVKVFAIDAFRYHIEKHKPVDASIELDGVVANHEETHDYSDAPMRRVRRTFDLPMLREPGTYVVEFVGNGISSRAVIHKGGLRMVERTAAAGQAVRIHDERGQPLPDATAWLGGREYRADQDGEILLPFSTAPGQKQLVLKQGNRSTIVPFEHRAESYELTSHMHVDREALVAGDTARLLVRPELALDEHPVSVTLLEDIVLRLTATDVDGQSTTQEVRDLKFTDDGELVHELSVPTRLRSLTASLTCAVKGLDGQKVALSGAQQTFAVNGIDSTFETGTPLLLRTTAGYALELRGKNGEPQAGQVCHLQLRHRDYRDLIQVSLQTDEAGRIQLGALTGVTTVQVNRDGSTGGWFPLTQAECRLPAALHGRAGQTLRVPYLGTRNEPTRRELSLLGHERDAFEHLAIQDGFVELRGLEPGDYELRLFEQDVRIPVRITAGARDHEWLVGRDRVLTASPTAPLAMPAFGIEGDELVVKIANATGNTRVHVVATRFAPAFDVFGDLRAAGAEPLTTLEQELPPTSYHAGRKLGDEYRYVLERRFATKFPGNMLQRPSLLLNPWALDRESWNAAVGLGGGAGGKFGGRGGGRGRRSQQDAQDGHAGTGGMLALHANLDWLPRGCKPLTNLKPSSDGTLRVPLADLGEGQQLHVIALDGSQAIYRTTVRAEQQLQPRARTLPESLDTQKHFAEQRRIEFVAAGATVDLDDVRSAKVAIHDSLAAAFRLFTTINGDESLAKFAFVVEWPSLSREKKLELYDQHVCHELNFFLFKKDPEFFREVVRPFLGHKLDKTFLDRWLLEDDLREFVDPWRFEQLNLVEKILLAQRLGGAERAAVARSIAEALELQPIPETVTANLFHLGLRADELADQDKSGMLEQLRRSNRPAMEPNQAPTPTGGGGAGGPAGPTTGGPGGPPTSKPGAVAGRVADRRAERQGAGKEDAEAEGVAADSLESLVEEKSTGSDDFYLGETAKRKSAQNQQLFRAVARTKMLVEQNWWRRPAIESTAGVVAANHFWADFAAAPAGAPFVSAALVEANGSFLEMMMALAVTDLPFEAGKHEVTADGDRRTLKAATPLLLVRKEVREAEPATDAAPLLLGENFYRVDDRYRWEEGQRRDKFVGDEFLTNVAYGCQVVVTNPTSGPRSAEVLLQIPAGAVPLMRGHWTNGQNVQLAPYATQTIEYSFYFPQVGSFSHYPAHASDNGELLANAAPRTLNVVVEPSSVDTSSWDNVSQMAAPTEVLTWLEAHNVRRVDLGKVAWRMRDRGFYTAMLQKLRAWHVYDDTLWSYSVLHRDAEGAREYLRHQDGFLSQCGSWIESPLVSADPKERQQYMHMEFDPLVHQRAHPLGGQHVFGNRDLAGQYSQLMNWLGYKPRLDSGDWLTVTYYLLLQDRIEEALQSFERVDPNKVPAKIQYDYLASYLCFFTGDTQRARRIAAAHVEHPVAHWQQRFREVVAQLDEAEGKVRPANDEPTQGELAATAPAIELAISGKQLTIGYLNLQQCEVRYYELDVEFAFSAQPFAGPDGASAAFVRPNHRETRDLPAGQRQFAFELPQRFWQKNVLVEVRAGGLVRSRQYFANALDVRFMESYGQVAVSEPDNGRPLAKTYVKVFAKLADGRVRFHKDGYTDLRGRFDYASLSDDPNASAVRYAVLVLDAQRGAVIRELAPPTR